jgi:hypothetical protein
MLTNKIREMFPGRYTRAELDDMLGYRFVQCKLRTYLNQNPELGYDIIIHGHGPSAWAEFLKEEKLPSE